MKPLSKTPRASLTMQDPRNNSHRIRFNNNRPRITPLRSKQKGRILVFVVEDGKLQLIVEKETKGVVCSLSSFHGKLLATINEMIQLYKWMLREYGTWELQYECGHNAHILAFCVQTRSDFIVICNLFTESKFLHEEGAIKAQAGLLNVKRKSAVE
ncbi:hypothetical protein GQ457_18G020710 [Hibiscus cannabinus]